MNTLTHYWWGDRLCPDEQTTQTVVKDLNEGASILSVLGQFEPSWQRSCRSCAGDRVRRSPRRQQGCRHLHDRRVSLGAAQYLTDLLKDMSVLLSGARRQGEQVSEDPLPGTPPRYENRLLPT